MTRRSAASHARRSTAETPRWRRYLRFWGPDPAADAADELGFHLEMLVEEGLAAGLSPADARRAAEARLGDRAGYERQCRQIGERRVRRMRRTERLDSLRHDLGRVARSLRRSPGFTTAMVLVLALGIGVDLLVFSITSGVLLRPLPYRDPDRLVRAFELFPLAGGVHGEGSVSYPNFRDWQRETRAFAGLGASGWPTSVVTDAGSEPERWTVVPMGTTMFPVLGVDPALGRTLGAGDADVGAEPVVVLSDEAWRRRFAADPAALGRTVTLDGRPHTVVGVMPAGFRYPVSRRAVDGWVPLGLSDEGAAARGQHALAVIGRLRDGVAAEQASRQLAAVAERLATAFPEEQEGRSAALQPLRDSVVGGVRDRLLALFGGATLVLLVACANAAGLLLARGLARRRDVAVQAALGATRGRLVRQLLGESLALSALAGVVGLGLCWLGLRALHAAGDLLPRTADIRLDGAAGLFLLAATVLTGLVFGLVPALRASRVDLQQDLRAAGRQAGGPGSPSPFRSALVVAQLTLSLVLLTSAGLLLRGFLNLVGTETGLQADGVLTFRVALPQGRHADPVVAFWEPLRERLGALPGVTAAGFISQLPLQDYGSNGNFGIAGKSYSSVAESPFAEFRVVSPGYFAGLGIPIVAGRDVAAGDRAGAAPTVWVNQTLARLYFAGETVVGQQITDVMEQPLTIAGVVGDVRQTTLQEPPRAEVYLPYAQLGDGATLAELVTVLRGGGEPERRGRAIRGAVADVDAQAAVFDLAPMTAVIAGSVADRRFYVGTVATFAAVALALALAGLYALVAYSVQQRRQELGIRLALGCGVRRIQGMVIAEGGRLALAGLALGLPASYLAARALGGLLYGIGPLDLQTYVAVALALVAATLIASWVPARRATRGGVHAALRGE